MLRYIIPMFICIYARNISHYIIIDYPVLDRPQVSFTLLKEFSYNLRI